MAAERQVAISTLSKSIPVLASSPGMTKITYDKVEKVVRPAMNSVLTVVPFDFKAKIFSNVLKGDCMAKLF